MDEGSVRYTAEVFPLVQPLPSTSPGEDRTQAMADKGQVVVQANATGEKPQPSMVAYRVMRAAANMMCRFAALTAAPNGVCVNVIGTNFVNYPGFREATGADDPKVMKRFCQLKAKWADFLPRAGNLNAAQSMSYQFVYSRMVKKLI